MYIRKTKNKTDQLMEDYYPNLKCATIVSACTVNLIGQFDLPFFILCTSNIKWIDCD